MPGADDTASESARNKESEAPTEPEFPSGITLILISIGLFLAAFCLGLVRRPPIHIHLPSSDRPNS
jgi:hypothetical protein